VVYSVGEPNLSSAEKTMDQSEAHSMLESRYEPLCASVVSAYRKYRKYPGRTIHRRTTRANIVNDEILAAVIGDFHDDPSIRLVLIRKKNLRFMQVDERVLLWFKKMDYQHKPKIYPTEHARHLEAGGQISMFPDCTILIVGYLLNRDETDIIRVSISKPAGRGLRPDWFIDLEPTEETNLAVMPKHKSGSLDMPRFRVVAKKGATQDKLMGS
jgi:hypothetical protein